MLADKYDDPGRSHPCGMIGGVDDEEDDVDGLHDSPKAIDGGNEEAVRLGDAVVEPQQRVEQRQDVRRRLELLRRPAPHDPPERLAVYICMAGVMMPVVLLGKKLKLLLATTKTGKLYMYVYIKRRHTYIGDMKTRTEMMLPTKEEEKKQLIDE